jgi:hypothetical protein
VSLEVVEKFVPSENHCIEQLLDPRIARLGLGQYLADVVYRPPDW